MTLKQKYAAGAGLGLLLLWLAKPKAAAAATPAAAKPPSDCLLRFFDTCVLRRPPTGPEGNVTAETYFRRGGKCKWSRTYANDFVLTTSVEDARCNAFDDETQTAWSE